MKKTFLGIISLFLFHVLTGSVSAQSVTKWEETWDFFGFPDGWQVINNDGSPQRSDGLTSAWIFTKDIVDAEQNQQVVPHAGQIFAYSIFSHANAAGLIDEWLISPRVFNIQSGDSLHFYAGAREGDYNDSLRVHISTTDDQLSSFTTQIGHLKVDGPVGSYHKYSFDLSDFAGSDIYFAVNYFLTNSGPNGSSGDQVWVDHFIVTTTSPISAPNLAQPGICYGSTGRGGDTNGSLITIDPSTGIGTIIGPTILRDEEGIAAVPGLAINSLGEIFATDLRVRSSLHRLDALTGNSTPVANTGEYYIEALAFDAYDVLYGAASDARFVTIDPYTGQSTLIGITGFGENAPNISGLAFDPTDGTLWASGGGGDDGIYTVDVSTGNATLIGETGLGGATPDIHFSADGTLYGVKGGGSSDNNLISINKITGAGTIIGPTGIVSVSGLAFRHPAMSGPQIGLSSHIIDFGSVASGLESSYLFTIRNIGSQNLDITDLSISGVDFGLPDQPGLPASLPPGDTLRILVAFAGSAPGPSSGSLNIACNDADDQTAEVDLVGHTVELNSAGSSLFYASSGFGDGGRLLTIDPLTGIGTLIGETGVPAMPGLAINSNGQIFGTSGYSHADLYQVDAASGAALRAANLDPLLVDAIAFDGDDNLYGVDFDVNLIRINVETGDTTIIGNIGVNISGLAFNPMDGTLWGSTGADRFLESDEIYTIDTENATPTLVGSTGLGGATPDLSFDAEGNLYGIKGGGNNQGNNLIAINTTNGAGTIIGSIGFRSVSGLAFSPQAVSVEYDTESESIPRTFSMSQNYPNPFNPSTTIRYQLPREETVRLSVLNQLGQEIRVLVNNKRQPGDHTEIWDGKDRFGKAAASGVYFMRIKAGEFRAIRKTALLK